MNKKNGKNVPDIKLSQIFTDKSVRNSAGTLPSSENLIEEDIETSQNVMTIAKSIYAESPMRSKVGSQSQLPPATPTKTEHSRDKQDKGSRAKICKDQGPETEASNNGKSIEKVSATQIDLSQDKLAKQHAQEMLKNSNDKRVVLNTQEITMGETESEYEIKRREKDQKANHQRNESNASRKKSEVESGHKKKKDSGDSTSKPPKKIKKKKDTTSILANKDVCGNMSDISGFKDKDKPATSKSVAIKETAANKMSKVGQAPAQRKVGFGNESEYAEYMGIVSDERKLTAFNFLKKESGSQKLK